MRSTHIPPLSYLQEKYSEIATKTLAPTKEDGGSDFLKLHLSQQEALTVLDIVEVALKKDQVLDDVTKAAIFTGAFILAFSKAKEFHEIQRAQQKWFMRSKSDPLYDGINLVVSILDNNDQFYALQQLKLFVPSIEIALHTTFTEPQTDDILQQLDALLKPLLPAQYCKNLDLIGRDEALLTTHTAGINSTAELARIVMTEHQKRLSQSVQELNDKVAKEQTLERQALETPDETYRRVWGVRGVRLKKAAEKTDAILNEKQATHFRSPEFYQNRGSMLTSASVFKPATNAASKEKTPEAPKQRSQCRIC